MESVTQGMGKWEVRSRRSEVGRQKSEVRSWMCKSGQAGSIYHTEGGGELTISATECRPPATMPEWPTDKRRTCRGRYTAMWRPRCGRSANQGRSAHIGVWRPRCGHFASQGRTAHIGAWAL